MLNRLLEVMGSVGIRRRPVFVRNSDELEKFRCSYTKFCLSVLLKRKRSRTLPWRGCVLGWITTGSQYLCLIPRPRTRHRRYPFSRCNIVFQSLTILRKSYLYTRKSGVRSSTPRTAAIDTSNLRCDKGVRPLC